MDKEIRAEFYSASTAKGDTLTVSGTIDDTATGLVYQDVKW